VPGFLFEKLFILVGFMTLGRQVVEMCVSLQTQQQALLLFLATY
jgi:hypothetical protein